MASLVAPANGEGKQVPEQQSSTMDPLRVDRASELASEHSSLAGGAGPVPSGVSPVGFSTSPSRQKELDLLCAAPLKSEEYRQLFRLPPGEVLVQDFNCAFQENMLYQGHLYVFRGYICFYSNIFGYESKKIIAFSEITLLRRAKSAGIFPNAIEISTGERKHFFTSFLSRDEAFNLISDLWPDRENISKEPENVPTAEDGNGPVTSSKQKENVEEAAQETSSESSPPDKSVLLKQDDTEAPKVSEDFLKVAEVTFPIKVDDFFTLFFSDTTFVESFHKSCGDTDFTCTTWCPSEKFGQVRELSFKHPIKFYLGAKSGSCREIQKVQAYRNGHLIVETSQEVNGVPFADYFTVEGIWDVENDESGEGCVMKVYVNVAFSKKTMWKGKIVQSTMDECREACAIWINIAHELLKKKNSEKQDKSPTHSVNEESSRILSQTDEHHRLPLLNTVNAGKPFHSEYGNHFSTTSSFGGRFAKILGAMRSQGYLPYLLVITVAVVLLMQSTIVLLLSRPPQVQQVYQMDYFSGMNQEFHPSPQQLAWLEKRLHHLKEEMLMVETRLERMRLEHKHLKSQLVDFESFSSKD